MHFVSSPAPALGIPCVKRPCQCRVAPLRRCCGPCCNTKAEPEILGLPASPVYLGAQCRDEGLPRLVRAKAREREVHCGNYAFHPLALLIDVPDLLLVAFVLAQDGPVDHQLHKHQDAVSGKLRRGPEDCGAA